ncbi:hypothetical protein M8C21_029450 [Ambrosia artemisiifolia]|uniref:Uncharacterized protein n=1 Tax=Ambrosia artemisiifolia TaxID=4212 RepID=A0AAD5D3Q2_AMBAR|nr:hypothetical protein M8C21_029450 [Ambrosia artemisiifolia]
MGGWKKWSGVVLPRLQRLEIKDCPNLVEVTLEALPSLSYLRISKCDSGVLRRLVEMASTVAKLKIEVILGLNDVVWRDVIEYLGAVEELKIECCNEIRYLVGSGSVASKVLVKLRKLKVRECDKLVSIVEKEDDEDNCRSNLLPSLRTLDVDDCKNMQRCSCPDGIEELSIWNCSSMSVVSFPKGGQEKLRSLKTWGCSKLLERELRGQEMNNSRSSFRMLEYRLKKPILEWGPKKKFPTSLVELRLYSDGEDGVDSCSQFSHILPSSLTSLDIVGFEKLESVVSMGLQHLSSLQHLSFLSCPNLKEVSLDPQHLTSLHHLTFFNCPKMKDLPELLLPSLLSCPNLEERCSINGSYWARISHIPCISTEFFDNDCNVLEIIKTTWLQMIKHQNSNKLQPTTGGAPHRYQK